MLSECRLKYSSVPSILMLGLSLWFWAENLIEMERAEEWKPCHLCPHPAHVLLKVILKNWSRTPQLQLEEKHGSSASLKQMCDPYFSVQGKLLSIRRYYWLVDVKQDPGQIPFDKCQELSGIFLFFLTGYYVWACESFVKV